MEFSQGNSNIEKTLGKKLIFLSRKMLVDDEYFQKKLSQTHEMKDNQNNLKSPQKNTDLLSSQRKQANMTGTVKFLNNSNRDSIIHNNDHLKLVDRQFALHLNLYIQKLEDLFLKCAIRDKAKNKLGF